MVDTVVTRKFSEFVDGGDLSNGETTVGLLAGANARYNNPWTFLPSGATGDRPVITPSIYYRLRLNTTLYVYEYYDPISATWTELSGSGTGTVNPGVTNDIPFYPANGTVLSPLAAAASSVLVTSVGMVPSLSTTLPTGLSIPGAIITSSTAALTAGSVVAAPVAGIDLVNKTYADGLHAGTVHSITGTTNQVIASSPTGDVTLSLPQNIALGSTPTFGGLTLTSIPLGSSSGGTGINNGSSTITIGGNVSYIGAHTFAGTLTGNTTVTYPTTGNLVSTNTTYVSSTPYTVLLIDNIILVDTETIAGPTSIVLPAAPTEDGKVWTIKDWSGEAIADPITITVSGGGLIDENSSVIINFPFGAVSIAWSTSQSTYSVVNDYDTSGIHIILGNSGFIGAPVVAIKGGTTGLTTTCSAATMNLTGILVGANGGTGINNGASTITLGGSLTTSGAFASTFTMTGATNVTFPTSGTLSTTVGTVTSVSGTANRITSTGGATPVIDISASYVGQSSITTLGTIATGIWNGTVITGTYGGTGVNNGASTITLGGSLTTSGAFASTFTMTSGTSVTFPTSGTLATVAGTVSSITGTANQIAASASTGAVTLSIVSNPILPGTGGVTLPTGNTAARAGGAGTMRFNSQTSVFEATVDGATWATIETSSTGVTSVSGTANRITSTGGTTPVIDISASYVGQSSITTLGTITTGVWTGTNIALANGGTNASLTASNGGIFYSTASAAAILSGTATAGQHLQSGASGAPSWTTATFPGTATSAGTILRSDGTNWVASTATFANTYTASNLLYSNGANTVTGLATANSSGLLTNGSGVPSWVTVTGTGAPVLATSPTITTPKIGTITDTNGANALIFIPTASAVNYLGITNNATGSPPALISTGSDTDVGMTLVSKGAGVFSFNTTASVNAITFATGTGYQHLTQFQFSNTSATRAVTFPDAAGTLLITGQAISTVPSIAFSSTSGIIGTTTNDNAAAGSVGESVTSYITTNTSISTATATNLTSISLTAGDWDVRGQVMFISASTTVLKQINGWISSTSASFPANYSTIVATDYGSSGIASVGVGVTSGVSCSPRRFSLSGTTTIYISGYATFTTSTLNMQGFIEARRVR